MSHDFSTDEAIKIYKSMIAISRMGFHNSTKSMYLELKERGFEFSVWEDQVVELYKGDKDYKWIQVKFYLYLIKGGSSEKWEQVKLLKKWNTTYCMSREDMFWDGWKDENVFINDSSSDIGEMLENCGIEINKVNYFMNEN